MKQRPKTRTTVDTAAVPASPTTNSMAPPPGWPRDSDWTELLAPLFPTPQFQQLMKFVAREREEETVYPPVDHVYQALRRTSCSATRAVILGQDPYHGAGQANGLSFSVPYGMPLPPSLKNIFREWQEDLGLSAPDHGNLMSWAEQGVLLLNTVLTVRGGEAHSHRDQGWELFTDRIISLLGQRREPVVFLLWGKPAEKKRKLIGPQHHVLVAPHPSPLSAYRGFWNSRPFSKTNQWLQEQGLDPIDWSLDPR